MKRVLIIDDDERIRSLVNDTLSGYGYEVIEAADGMEGVRLFREDPTDLIITDLLMPEKEGIETIVELRRDFPKVKILVISGSLDTHLRMAKMLGADMTLSKPFELSFLLASVRELTEND
jgi:DNA-binding response OmpR family regulator